MGAYMLAGVDDTVLITVCCGAVMTFIAGLLIVSRYQSSQTVENRTHNDENHHSYSQDVCPICLSAYVLAVETNCGHKFCGLCMKNYLSRTSGDFALFSSRASCPICRQDINILLRCFLPEESLSLELENDKVAVERTVHEYNVRFGGPRNLWGYIRDCPVLIKHMFYDFFTFGGLVWMFRLRVILCGLGAFVYFHNPLDIIPEAMFGIFGFLDDVIIFLLCVIYVSIIYRRLVISRTTATTT